MRKMLLLCLPVLAFLTLVDGVRGQSRITCRSRDYQYQRCPAITSQGVRLVEQLSRSECRLGTSWGYDRDGIWVDKGCAAVFEIFSSLPEEVGESDPVSLCKREVLFEVQRRYGSYSRVEFEGVPGSRTERSGERRVDGQIRFWNGRTSSLSTYTCWVDARSGRIRQLDLAEGRRWEGDNTVVSVCQSAVQGKLQRDQGQGIGVGFEDDVRVTSASRNEHLVDGDGWFKMGYSRLTFEYQCSVEGRNGRVNRADYRVSSGISAPGGGFSDRCDRFPVLYADDTFRGRTFSLERSVRNLHDAGFGDTASSICVPINWMVTLYEDTDFRGLTLVLDGPYRIADLARDQPEGGNWGDRISSAEVFFRQPDSGEPRCDRTPALFADDSFRGKRVDVSQSISDLHSRGLGDNVSSLCVPWGWEITVFEDKGFSGGSLEIPGPATIGDLKRDQPGGTSWGDRISSVRVDRQR